MSNDNVELKDYTVLAPEGIDVAGIEYLEGQTVSLSDADAAAYLEAGTIAAIVPPVPGEAPAEQETPAEGTPEQQ